MVLCVRVCGLGLKVKGLNGFLHYISYLSLIKGTGTIRERDCKCSDPLTCLEPAQTSALHEVSPTRFRVSGLVLQCLNDISALLTSPPPPMLHGEELRNPEFGRRLG